ncbi:SDR family oxidoreductase [Taklimakanibacter albus]|uniref:SDR family oxidoreductase n=1 Tax=Taklimakanibacter albus TaxID=2800327 RepID=A0ACC5QY68_9HYPH|nr:SDR family oxidoreductase [Aestuariivirga sp. YIM B02566]MBK1865336.1 SDR family oxidoreductase [Aestuariivirga sp. YIM B02566]
MDLGLKGRTAIVCASSRGLGKACALSLAREGVAIVINGRDEKALAATRDEIVKATGAQVTAIIADVGTKEGQDALLAACPEPDILINNNGGPPLRDFRELDREALLAGVVQNMVTPIELIQRVVPGMTRKKFGRIVNITSVSVKMPILGLDLSSGARAGLTAFMAGPARDLAAHNITVNHLLPGMFDTDRLRNSTGRMAKMQGKSDADMAAQRQATVPAKRFGEAHEIGEICAFLCSVQAGYVTGQSILVDGGLFNAV